MQTIGLDPPARGLALASRAAPLGCLALVVGTGKAPLAMLARNVVDNFETAIRRDVKHKGFLVAYSFGKGAVEEAARSKDTDAAVHLVKVADLLRVNLSRETPEVLGIFAGVGGRARRAWPPPPSTKPAAEELVENVRAERAGVSDDGS